MTENKCQHTVFYETFLKEESSSSHSVTTGLGLSTFRVSNQDLLQQLINKIIANFRFPEKEDLTIYAEYTYMRDRFLFFKPERQNNAIGIGLLTLRIGNHILQYFVSFTDTFKIQSATTLASHTLKDSVLTDKRLDEVLYPIVCRDLEKQLIYKFGSAGYLNRVQFPESVAHHPA